MAILHECCSWAPPGLYGRLRHDLLISTPLLESMETGFVHRSSVSASRGDHRPVPPDWQAKYCSGSQLNGSKQHFSTFLSKRTPSFFLPQPARALWFRDWSPGLATSAAFLSQGRGEAPPSRLCRRGERRPGAAKLGQEAQRPALRLVAGGQPQRPSTRNSTSIQQPPHAAQGSPAAVGRQCAAAGGRACGVGGSSVNCISWCTLVRPMEW